MDESLTDPGDYTADLRAQIEAQTHRRRVWISVISLATFALLVWWILQQMSLKSFWLQTLNGLSFGAVLFFMASGFTLIFGLMTNPRLLLMDEPSEGLAPIVLRVIRERLQDLKGSDLSILLVEQNLGLAQALGDRVAIMAEHGHIVWDGTPDEVEADPTAKTTHLGV